MAAFGEEQDPQFRTEFLCGGRGAARHPGPPLPALPAPDAPTQAAALAKQLEYLAGAQIAGIVLGARVPIILTSRADKTLSRLASCAIALLLARRGASRRMPTAR